MNLHEQLIRSIAYEIALAVYGDIYINANLPYRETIIRQHLPAAHIAVKHMAETAASIWWKESDLRTLNEQKQFDIYLEAVGLIPPTDKEAEKDEAK